MASPTLAAYDRMRLANKTWMDPVLPGFSGPGSGLSIVTASALDS